VEPTLVAAVAVLLLALCGLATVWVLWRRARGAAVRVLANAQEEAERIIAKSELDGQRIQKDTEILARERLLAARTEFERETRELRLELTALDLRLAEQRAGIDERAAVLEQRQQSFEVLKKEIEEREGRLVSREDELAAAIAEQRVRLEQIAGLTVDQAKAELLRSMENEARIDAANLVKKIEDETVEKSKEKARRVISMAIQRIASEHVVESTVSVVDLPSDEMKGRIIGREGRNIRAFEQATGVDLIVDDTPEAVILSAFDPYRREIAGGVDRPDRRAARRSGGTARWSRAPRPRAPPRRELRGRHPKARPAAAPPSPRRRVPVRRRPSARAPPG